jgi:hypothetical protein
VGYGQTMLISEKTVEVSYKATKTESSKKKDTWQIEVTVQTPSGDTYFEKGKTGNPLTDMANNRYVKISVPNHAGVFSSGDKYFTAEKANVVTSASTAVYEIIGSEHRETFTFDLPTGVAPEVHAQLLADLKDRQYLPIAQATPEELSTGMQTRVFLMYKELDTMLLQRDPVLRFMNSKNKPAQATYGNGAFLVRDNTSTADSLTGTLTYSDWNNRKMTARVAGDGFETSLKGTFADTEHVMELKMKDPGDEKRLIRLEKIKKNVLVFNQRVPASALPVADNGAYSMVIGNNGALQIKNNGTGAVVWSNTDFGSAPSGFLATVENHNVKVNLVFYKQNANGIPERGAFLTLSNDGHLRIFRSDGYAMWEK